MIFTPALNNAMALLGRAMIAMLFIPGGISKLTGFAGTVGYIASKGVPLPEVCAAIAIIVELGLGIALLVGWKTRWAALAIACLMFLNPLIEFFSQDMRAHQESSMMRELIRMEPAMAQELRAMEMHQQYRDELALEERQEEVSALQGIGASSLKPAKQPARRHSDNVVTA